MVIMSTAPMSAAKLLEILKAEGLTVVEVGNWRTHNRNHKGPFGPVNGVMIHHTVTQGSASTVNICRTGYSSLPGPLCHGVITKDGRVHLVGYGRANHAGLGDDDVLNAVRNQTSPLPADNESNTDGNRSFYGFECENLGNGKDPWPGVQLAAIEKVSAAICRHHGWNERSVIGHLEWQPGKVDPRGFTMGSMREKIRKRLGTKPLPPRPQPTGTHTVKAGDTLWRISQTYDITVARLRELNPQVDRDVITVGMVLKLTGSTAKYHRIAEGDTLWAISRKYKVTVPKLRDLNPLIKGDLLTVGDQVRYA